ncbi:MULTISPECIES: hypothetical protein [unclassified Microcystis]|nr:MULTISPECIES: hypothetical protein [unclassified Microcystis]
MPFASCMSAYPNQEINFARLLTVEQLKKYVENQKSPKVETLPR